MYTHYAWQTTRVEGLVTETDRAGDFKSRARVIVELERCNGKVCIFTGARFENVERVVLELIRTNSRWQSTQQG